MYVVGNILDFEEGEKINVKVIIIQRSSFDHVKVTIKHINKRMIVGSILFWTASLCYHTRISVISYSDLKAGYTVFEIQVSRPEFEPQTP